ncbi:MAG: Anaphase-promoting complex, cyclosome, subunit 3 [Candidatus Scalindua rubra]|uniref:Anaphase-promoting complex, cyclosome, subunit 3 n=1 Tax=Candidatus Scalindua rubra TaxID=1872076 RepID=A0A1E3X429_9BACT|nr:MAG: Anaphase-promoting complex, cyclosome, subunit 3 [Candidatus Scalindua rubra]
MDIRKRILVLLAFGVVYLCILNDVLSEDKTSENKDIEVNEPKTNVVKEEASEATRLKKDNSSEIEKMLEKLEKEKNELEKLKAKFKDKNHLNELIKENEEINKVVSKDTEKNEEKSETLVSIIDKKLENKESPVSEDDNFKASIDENGIKEIIRLESEVDEIEDNNIVVKSGEEIVHPFEIAENLYKLDEYETALDIYKLIDKNGQEKEKKTWISYQIANCYRKLGLLDKAMEAYRKMQKEYEGTYWAKQAQWYIQDIEWRAKVKDELEMVIGR